MTYDPRAGTGIPTEPVGSLPRPSKLQAAYAAYDAGEISKADLEAEQDETVRDSIARMEATGSPIVSDGEQRWSSFATYPITDTLAGTGLADHLAGDGQYFAILRTDIIVSCRDLPAGLSATRASQRIRPDFRSSPQPGR